MGVRLKLLFYGVVLVLRLIVEFARLYKKYVI